MIPTYLGFVSAALATTESSVSLRNCSRVSAPIEPGEAVDGCGCLRCRNVDPTVARHALVDDVVWAARLLGRRPSIPLAAVGLGVVAALADPTPLRHVDRLSIEAGSAVGTVGALLLHTVVLRAYVGVVAADALTGRRSSAAAATPLVLRRAVPLLGAIAAILLLAGGAFLVVGVAVGGVVQAVSPLDWALFSGPLAAAVFGTPMAFVLYKFWLAPEVCVVGRAGPLTALRTSWAITDLHWLRAGLVVVGFAATAIAPDAAATAADSLGSERLTGALEAAAVPFRWVLTTVWYCVGVQLYARAVLR